MSEYRGWRGNFPRVPNEGKPAIPGGITPPSWRRDPSRVPNKPQTAQSRSAAREALRPLWRRIFWALTSLALVVVLVCYNAMPTHPHTEVPLCTPSRGVPEVDVIPPTSLLTAATYSLSRLNNRASLAAGPEFVDRGQMKRLVEAIGPMRDMDSRLHGMQQERIKSQLACEKVLASAISQGPEEPSWVWRVAMANPYHGVWVSLLLHAQRSLIDEMNQAIADIEGVEATLGRIGGGAVDCASDSEEVMGLVKQVKGIVCGFAEKLAMEHWEELSQKLYMQSEPTSSSTRASPLLGLLAGMEDSARIACQSFRLYLSEICSLGKLLRQERVWLRRELSGHEVNYDEAHLRQPIGFWNPWGSAAKKEGELVKDRVQSTLATWTMLLEGYVHNGTTKV